ncbi:hypothetical protein [Streptomyces sp. NPDC093225]|uniref:hypothetical protein n=1 Tax=Streptomyces sp. NPDC093225 TaxID=3366034 RepID=UPI0037F9BF74
MSQEHVPQHTGQAEQDKAVPAQSGAPKGLLQQMEELMAALNADLSQLDADLQTSAERRPEPVALSHDAEGELPSRRSF